MTRHVFLKAISVAPYFLSIAYPFPSMNFFILAKFFLLPKKCGWFISSISVIWGTMSISAAFTKKWDYPSSSMSQTKICLSISEMIVLPVFVGPTIHTVFFLFQLHFINTWNRVSIKPSYPSSLSICTFREVSFYIPLGSLNKYSYSVLMIGTNSIL